MKSLGLKGKQRKNGKYHSYKGEIGKIADNLLKRNFNASKPYENSLQMLHSLKFATKSLLITCYRFIQQRNCSLFYFTESEFAAN